MTIHQLLCHIDPHPLLKSPQVQSNMVLKFRLIIKKEMNEILIQLTSNK